MDTPPTFPTNTPCYLQNNYLRGSDLGYTVTTKFGLLKPILGAFLSQNLNFPASLTKGPNFRIFFRPGPTGPPNLSGPALRLF